jgi:hypothetical protein
MPFDKLKLLELIDIDLPSVDSKKNNDIVSIDGFSSKNKDITNLKLNLEDFNDFKEIFEFVKKAVKRILNRERAGLMLVLADLPLKIGAFHGLGSNSIVMNRRLFEAVKDAARTKLEVNSYVFIILLHEYLHSLGCVDERMTRRLVYDISNELFGEGHPATRMALDGIPKLIEDSRVKLSLKERSPEIIKEFDSSYRSYIH